jgi:hypothetical protein
MTIEILLPFATPSQNELNRWHWAKKRRFRDQCRLWIRSQMRSRGLSPEAAPRCKRRVEVIRRGLRTLDFDNLVGGFKPVLDAMRMEFLLFDDSPDWVDGKYRQEKNPGPQRHGSTRILVSEIP